MVGGGRVPVSSAGEIWKLEGSRVLRRGGGAVIIDHGYTDQFENVVQDELPDGTS